MKNQYFGDNRDLFKYDLVLQIIQSGLVNHFTLIPMLTESDDTKHGGETNRGKAKSGTDNKELMSFLDECVKEDKRDIKQLERFFKKKTIPITIYGKDFSHAGRQEYFKQIVDKLHAQSLILVDPDTGLEVERSRETHIRYIEINNLYERMDNSSILMIYQHFPREDHHEHLHRRSEELEEKVSGELPISIDDNENIFFFLTKDEPLEELLTKVISDYTEHYS